MEDSELEAYASRLVDGAEGDTVTIERLTDDTTNEPIVSYLFEDEQPHYIFTLDCHAGKLATGSPVTVTDQNGLEKTSSSGADIEGWLAITDMRIILLVNGAEDDVVSIPLSSVEDIQYENKGGLIKSSYGTDVELSTNSYKYQFSTSEDIRGAPIEYIENETGLNQSELDEKYFFAGSDSVFVCRECKEEVSADAKKCPHCGYYPGKGGKGALWHGASLVVWPMMVKGAADELRARRGVGEEQPLQNESDEMREDESDSPFDKLERLKELKDEGVITESEFQSKKDELLDDI